MTITCRLPYACDAGTTAKLTKMLNQTGNVWLLYVENAPAGDLDTFFTDQQVQDLLELVRRFNITGD